MPQVVVRSRQSDDGATLIFALVIITTIALVTGALLLKSGGNFRTTVALRNVAGTAYAADAAAKNAINDIVMGAKSTVQGVTYPNGVDGTPATWVFDNNTDGSGCFGKRASDGTPLANLDLSRVYTLPDNTDQSATVVCTPVLGTGLFGSGNGTVPVQVPDTDTYARALTTIGTTVCTVQGTGTGCSDGITLKPLGSGGDAELPMRGSIASKTFINVTSGSLRTTGTVNAGTTCTSNIKPACVNGFPSGITPPTPPLSAVPAWQNPATQGCNFQPGYYNNGNALSSAVNACATAKFASGKYYFDFADNNPWDIATTVVGGVPTTDTAIPGRCVSPIDSPTTPGVQFVFGGSSYIQVEDSGHVELCGPANGGYAPITIYQQTAGSTPAEQIVPTATAGTVSTLSSGKNDAFGPASPASASLVTALSATGNPTADWKSTKAGNTGELDLRNFAGLSSIPVGATITSAKLRVSYTNGLAAGNTFTANVSGQPATSAVTVATSGTDTDITSLLNAQFAVGAFTATNPTIQLMISGSNKNDTFSVDAVTLSVKYVLAGLRAATTPATFITDKGGNFSGTFVVQGATYAPKGFITLTPGNGATAPNGLVAFRWGIYAWGVNFKSLPQQLWGYPLVSIPDPGYGLGSAITAVDLKVYICDGVGPCATSGDPTLTSRAEFTDGTDSDGIVHPVAGQRKVTVLSWAVQR